MYIPGTSNLVEDALSHPASGTVAAREASCCAAIADRTPFDLWDMALANPLHSGTKSPLQQGAAHCHSESRGDLGLLGGTAMGTFQSLVPMRTSSDRFLTAHMALYTQVCEPPIASSPSGLSGSATTHTGAHEEVSHIHEDLVSRGFTYFFTIVDRTSRWPETISTAANTMGRLCQCLVSGVNEQILCPSSHHIGPRRTGHFFPIGPSVANKPLLRFQYYWRSITIRKSRNASTKSLQYQFSMIRSRQGDAIL